MVIDFAKDYRKSANIDIIEMQIKDGDMTSVLEEYERELKTPSWFLF
jgi:ATP synthase regulation protein NCA2